MKLKRRILAFMMMFAMIFTMMPGFAMADTEPNVEWAGYANYNDANNQVTNIALPDSSAYAAEKWAYQLGTIDKKDFISLTRSVPLLFERLLKRMDATTMEDLLKENIDKCVRIPMRNGLRSLNLSNSAAIAVYEVLRQRDFDGLLEEGVFPNG